MHLKAIIFCLFIGLLSREGPAASCAEMVESTTYLSARDQIHRVLRADKAWDEIMQVDVVYPTGFLLFDMMISHNAPISLNELYSRLQENHGYAYNTLRLLVGKLRTAGYIQTTINHHGRFVEVTPEGLSKFTQFINAF